ncbi:MAG: peptide deformylase [Rhodobacteraceae bacterium]|nr:peptide deformylase [Paracoccaceae bacterium]MCF8516784.1 peptide deformylase [Paracoccaceae bacterium]MCF8521095.1 peptide deformylase [Paracoccaceae bacterium]
MAILPILRWPDARLSTRASAVEGITPGIHRLAQEMLETMYAAPGRGLAAPQVGVLQRLFVMDVTWKTGTPDPMVCINPEILWRSAVVATGDEGCLSIPGPITRIARAQAIQMAWTGLDGLRVERRLSGFAAICAQHEYDHLDGIVTLDRLAPAERAQALSQFDAVAA